MKKIRPKLFDAYVNKVKEQISLLEGFALPKAYTWKVNWNEIDEVISSSDRTRWQRLSFYNVLLERKHSPAIYYFEIDTNDSNSIHKLFLKRRKVVSTIKIKQGVAAAGFRNISFVSTDFEESECLYVGSRKRNVHRRLLQHLGFGSSRTGGLNLNFVLANEKRNFQITFHCHFLDDKYKVVTESIEAVVQTHLKPIVGKRILGD